MYNAVRESRGQYLAHPGERSQNAPWRGSHLTWARQVKLVRLPITRRGTEKENLWKRNALSEDTGCSRYRRTGSSSYCCWIHEKTGKQTGLRPGRNSYSRERTSDLILLVMWTVKNTGNQRICMSEKRKETCGGKPKTESHFKWQQSKRNKYCHIKLTPKSAILSRKYKNTRRNKHVIRTFLKRGTY